jgi:hypothetical protein
MMRQLARDTDNEHSTRTTQLMNNIHLLIPLISLLIPILAIVMGVSIAILAIYLNYKKRKEMFVLYHQERMAAIEKGIELPPLPDAFFTDESKGYRARSPHRPLLVGLILLFIGLILFVTFYYRSELDAALFSLVPAGIGLAYLIYYFAVSRKEAVVLAAAEKARAATEANPQTT